MCISQSSWELVKNVSVSDDRKNGGGRMGKLKRDEVRRGRTGNDAVHRRHTTMLDAG